MPPPPRGLNSMQFSAKNLQNNRLAHPFWELAPPQENPGSAIDYIFIKEIPMVMCASKWNLSETTIMKPQSELYEFSGFPSLGDTGR